MRTEDLPLGAWARVAETRGVWTEMRSRALPLRDFPSLHLARIREEVESSERPSKWLDLEMAQIISRAWYEWHWQRGIDPDARRPAIPMALRRAVLKRDGLICQLCGGDVAPHDVHLDHKKPWSRGGRHTLVNLQVAHSLCNLRKSARWEDHECRG